MANPKLELSADEILAQVGTSKLHLMSYNWSDIRWQFTLFVVEFVVFVPIQLVNKSETLWGPDAATFNPERWLFSEKDK